MFGLLHGSFTTFDGALIINVHFLMTMDWLCSKTRKFNSGCHRSNLQECDEQYEQISDKANEIKKALETKGIRVKLRWPHNAKPGYKFAEWELKGIPLRLQSDRATLRIIPLK